LLIWRRYQLSIFINARNEIALFINYDNTLYGINQPKTCDISVFK
jgi:hypothetical protein